MGATAFVTGGSGFAGGALIRRLAADGWTVRALARSDASAATVQERGAEPVTGDLDDTAALRKGAQGADVVFHAAAHLGDWGDRAAFERVNVQGTQNVCAAANGARVVHVGTEAALMDGTPLVHVDEHAPLKPNSPVLYSATKARAEAAAIKAGALVIRPRFIWGPGDTTLVPAMKELIEKGQFAWIGGGRHLTSTTHVDNCVEGLIKGAEKGTPGAAYFVLDGPPVVFRDFLTRLLQAHGLAVPDRNVPKPVAGALMRGGELAWKLLPLKGQPPLTRFAYWVSTQECTLDDTKARTQLGYRPVVSVDDGLATLSQAS